MAKLVDGKKKQLAMLSATLLAMVPWMQISKAVANQVSVQPSALATAVAAGVAIHFLFLAFNMTAVKALKLGRGDNASGMPLTPWQSEKVLCRVVLFGYVALQGRLGVCSLHRSFVISHAQNNTEYIYQRLLTHSNKGRKTSFRMRLLKYFMFSVHKHLPMYPSYCSIPGSHNHLEPRELLLITIW